METWPECTLSLWFIRARLDYEELLTAQNLNLISLFGDICSGAKGAKAKCGARMTVGRHQFSFRKALCHLLAKLMLLGFPCQGQSQSGPLLVRSQAIGQLFRLNPPIMDAALLPNKEFSFAISRSYANLWARDKRFVIDGEVIDDQVRFALGLAKRWQVGIGFGFRRFAQASTDQLAISFHDLFNIGQDGRLETGKHRTRFAIPDYNLEFSGQELDQVFSEQTLLDLSYGLMTIEDQGFDLSLTGLMSYEMAALNPYFHGAMDKGLQLNSRIPWGSWNFYASMARLFFDQRQVLKVPTRKSGSSLSGGFSFNIQDQHYLLWQAMMSRPVFHELGQLSRNSYEWQIGYRYSFDAVMIEVAVIENIFWLYNSPDWGYSFGLQTQIK